VFQVERISLSDFRNVGSRVGYLLMTFHLGDPVRPKIPCRAQSWGIRLSSGKHSDPPLNVPTERGSNILPCQESVKGRPLQYSSSETNPFV